MNLVWNFRAFLFDRNGFIRISLTIEKKNPKTPINVAAKMF